MSKGMLWPRILLSSLVVGLAILLVAIIVNILAGKLGWSTWYDFLQKAASEGFSIAFGMLKLQELLFLFMLYPLSLGATAYGVFRLLGRIP
jgi:hypothetical protein